jgi:TATA-box binding protein (TBP) (component of TFIID and TFIIIB)
MDEYNIDDEWTTYLETNELNDQVKYATFNRTDQTCPTPTNLYISTKSLINYLNKPIDINNLFWKIQITPYSTPCECIIKKQIKFTFLTKESLHEMEEKLKNESFIDTQIINSIDNPEGRIKFKDVRKVSVGISKKDITTRRSKKKGAFYNCLVVIMRILLPDDPNFKETHIKLFNTGKIEIPGIQSSGHVTYILNKIIELLQPFYEEPLMFNEENSETVLINSNFNCNFYINRDVLFEILHKKYNIQCVYEQCSYPGIQCKYMLNTGTDKEVEVSYMIFRTGSVLIVGKCGDDDINRIYEYVKNILTTEYEHINQITPIHDVVAPKKQKMRKRTIQIYEI